MLTKKLVTQEINRPIVIGQVSNYDLFLRFLFYPENKSYSVACYKKGVELKQYHYDGKDIDAAVKAYNDGFNDQVPPDLKDLLSTS